MMRPADIVGSLNVRPPLLNPDRSDAGWLGHVVGDLHISTGSDCSLRQHEGSRNPTREEYRQMINHRLGTVVLLAFFAPAPLFAAAGHLAFSVDETGLRVALCATQGAVESRDDVQNGRVSDFVPSQRVAHATITTTCRCAFLTRSSNVAWPSLCSLQQDGQAIVWRCLLERPHGECVRKRSPITAGDVILQCEKRSPEGCNVRDA